MGIDLTGRQRLGESLVERGLVTADQLERAIEVQKHQGGRLGDILLEQGWVQPYAFYSALADHYNRPFVNLFKDPPDPTLYTDEDLPACREHRVFPWKIREGLVLFATCDPTPEALVFVQERWGDAVDFVITSRFDLIWQLQNHARERVVGKGVVPEEQGADARQRLGDQLVEQGLITQEQLDEAITLQQREGGRLGEIILARGWITPYRFHALLAEHYQRPFINLMLSPPDGELFDPADAEGYQQHQLVPWQRRDGAIYVALCEPNPQAIEFAVARFGEGVDFVITSRFDIIWVLHDQAAKRFGAQGEGETKASSDEPPSRKQRLGESLVAHGLISQAQLDEAILLQQAQGGRLGDIILAKGWTSAYKFYRALAEHYQRPFINLIKSPPERALFDPGDVEQYLRHRLIPWQQKEGVTYLALYEPTPEAVEFAADRFGDAIDFVITSRFDLIWVLHNHADGYFAADGDSAGRMARRFAIRKPLGEHLMAQGLISDAQLAQAIDLQRRWGSRLGDIILAKGWVTAYRFYQALADHYQRPFVNLEEDPLDEALFDHHDIDSYVEYSLLPWRHRDGITYVAVYDPTPEAIEFAVGRWGEQVDFVITSKFDIMWQLQSHANEYFSEMAVNGLAKRLPEQSALEVFTRRQLLWFAGLGYLLLALVTIWPVSALSALNLFIAVFLLCNFGLRWLFTWEGGDRAVDMTVTPHMIAELEDHELPTYTVLVPMYKEPETLPILSNALRNMDYPLSKLDIKLVLEADDQETIESAKKLGLEAIFEIIRVPPSQPKTKPKACNYALNFSRGELVTIYDAEDKPEPDQLKKAVAAFKVAAPNTACIQARLNYFNSNENWLTRMFTLEYSLWFDFYLPALDKLRIPIPLGGTSNHFKMDVLRKLQAWDPYNVTEDADLGVRITQMGYRVGVVNSTTYEEANTRFGNWIRQRSRWIKGYMQTYLVHMRKPIELYRSLGHVGFWGFQFFIGGTIVSTLLPPFLYGMFIFWLMTGSSALDDIFPPFVLYISLINMLVGNGFFIYITGLGAFKRRYYRLIPYAVTAPFYWLLMSIAAYKALWQLVYKPFYWEKTVHGLSSFHKSELDAAKPGVQET